MTMVKHIVVAFLMALLGACAVAPAAAPGEPPNLTAFRADFMSGVAELGQDPSQCAVKDMGPRGPGQDTEHVIHISCRFLSHVCAAILHKTKPQATVVGCVPNPDYIEPDDTPEQGS